MLEKLVDEFVYIFLLYVSFILLLQAILSLPPRIAFIPRSETLRLPLYVGVALWLAELGVDFLRKSIGFRLLAENGPINYSVVAGLFLGDFIYCALVHTCDFTKCNMPVSKLGSFKPCRGYAFIMALALWMIPAVLLRLVGALSWWSLAELSLVAWIVVLFQGLLRVLALAFSRP